MRYPEPDSSAEDPQDFQHQSPPSYSMIAGVGNPQQLREFLVKLNVDHRAKIEYIDMTGILSSVHNLSPGSRDRAHALINSPQIQSWVTGPNPAVLHINGQMFHSQHEARQSPLSLTCAQLVDDFLRRIQPQQNVKQPLIVLRWFCGQHTNFIRDRHAHPAGMLNNLLSQFVLQLRSLGVSSISAHLPTRGYIGIEEKCKAFVELVHSLPPGTILFCILDGVSHYENADHRDALTEVLELLRSLKPKNYDIRKQPVIKILTTAPLKSSIIPGVFDKDEILNMDQVYPRNGGSAAMQRDTGIGRVLMDSSQDMERWTEADIRSSTNHTGAESAHRARGGKGRRVIQ